MKTTKLINGQPKTRDEAVVENMRLVKKIAARYENKANTVRLGFEDLVSVGYIGLIKAYDHFDDSLGFRFSTYAVPKIIGEISRLIESTNPGPHYPTDIRRYADKIQKYELEESSVEEISGALGISKKRAQLALEYLAQGLPHSLDRPLPGKNNEEYSPFEEIVGKDQDVSSVIVREFIQALTDKEKEIAFLLMKDLTHPEVGRIMGCSYQAIGYHVSRIRAKWNLYQYGLPADKKKKTLEKMLDEQEMTEMKAMLNRLKARQRVKLLENVT